MEVVEEDWGIDALRFIVDMRRHCQCHLRCRCLIRSNSFPDLYRRPAVCIAINRAGVNQATEGAKLLRRLVVGLLLISLGACWHLNWARDLIAERLPEILKGKTLQVEGVVIGLPER